MGTKCGVNSNIESLISIEMLSLRNGACHCNEISSLSLSPVNPLLFSQFMFYVSHQDLFVLCGEQSVSKQHMMISTREFMAAYLSLCPTLFLLPRMSVFV